MPQTRLYLIAPRAEAALAYDILEAAFEEDGWPLAITEVDEVAGLQGVEIYVDDAPEPIAARMRVLLGEAGIPAELKFEALPDIDWVAKSLEGLKPVRAGRFVVHGAHDRDMRRPGDIAIEIEAGQAFGTGHHGTTSGCLEMIQDVVTRDRPRNALDLGTGSAVLAIAVARLAHIPVLATDIDPVATRVAAENVRLNRMAGLVRCVTATGFDHVDIAARRPNDLIIANILARPLMALAPKMARHLVPGGSLILSGILDRQRNAVLASYNGQHFRHVRTIHREGWSTIHLMR